MLQEQFMQMQAKTPDSKGEATMADALVEAMLERFMISG